jgi:hypothetical protein
LKKEGKTLNEEKRSEGIKKGEKNNQRERKASQEQHEKRTQTDNFQTTIHRYTNRQTVKLYFTKRKRKRCETVMKGFLDFI